MYQAIYIKSENKWFLESRNLKKLEKVSYKFFLKRYKIY